MKDEPEGRRLRTASARQRGSSTREEVKRVTRSSAYGDEQEKNEVLKRRTFAPGVEPAFVRISAGGTYNLGNYESLRIDVSVTMPCLADEVEQARDAASDFVREALAEEEMQWLGRATLTARPEPKSKPKAASRR